MLAILLYFQIFIFVPQGKSLSYITLLSPRGSWCRRCLWNLHFTQKPSGQGKQNNKNQGPRGCPFLRISCSLVLLIVLCKLGWGKGFSNNSCHWTWPVSPASCIECSWVSWESRVPREMDICNPCGIRTWNGEVRGQGLALVCNVLN